MQIYLAKGLDLFVLVPALSGHFRTYGSTSPKNKMQTLMFKSLCRKDTCYSNNKFSYQSTSFTLEMLSKTAHLPE